MSAFSLLIEIAALRRGLDAVAAALPGKTTVPIITHVKLEANGPKLKLTATDLDRAIEAEVAAIEVSGAITLPGKALRDVLKRFNDGCQVAIASDGVSAQVKGGRGRARLPALPAADFPPAPAPGEDAPELVIDGKTLAGLLDGVAYAACTDLKARFYLCGVHLETIEADDGLRLRAVACDGFRLNWRDAPLISGAMVARPVIVPNETVALATKAAGAGGEASIAFDAARFRLACAGVTLSSRLVDATYPDYRRVAPSAADTPVLATIDREQLARAIEAALAVGTDKGRLIRIAIHEDRLVVDRDEGDYEVEMTIDAEAAATDAHAAAFPYVVGVNGQYLAQTLAGVGGDTLDLRLLTGDRRLHVSLHGKGEDTSAYAIVMPQRLKPGSARPDDDAASEKDAA
ncbi:DNA polymerase III subunit beta [Methylopila musalis]|uniref:Beta sliding clamp n=1 Tax=Methylopila musalis TaxID=1134781 RepID=A0ABW3Z3B0_9HYPH